MAPLMFENPSMVVHLSFFRYSMVREAARAAATGTRIAFASVVMIFGASCGRSAPPKQCLQFSSDLMPAFTGGLNRKDFRMANAWAVKSDQMIDSAGVKFPAYFLSADIIAPNGEAVVGTWLTTDVNQGRLIYSLSPQAKKYTNWAEAGTASTPGITMDTPGAKESISCVLNGRAASPQAGIAPKATTP